MRQVERAKKEAPSKLTIASRVRLGLTGGNPPDHLAKAKWAKELRTRYEVISYSFSNTPWAKRPGDFFNLRVMVTHLGRWA